MRVVITHTDLRIYWPSRIAALQQALESRGDELYIIEIAGAGSHYDFHNSRPSGPTASDSSPVTSAGVKNWICLYPTTRMEDISPARAARKLVAALNSLMPDVVMAGSIAFPSGAASVYWAKKNCRPVVMFDDIRSEDVPRNGFVNYIKKLIYHQVDAVLCPAAEWVEGLRRWDFSPRQLFFGVDVVDNDFWSAPDPQTAPPEGLQEWPAPFFLAVGRQIPVKNFPFLLEVYDTYRNIAGERSLALVMIGEGPERVLIQQIIREKRMRHVYLFPFANPEKLKAFYHHAAALVMPSKCETWGLVVNEAMAAGLPVLVSSHCGCAPVLVKEHVNGYTFHPDRKDKLLTALLSFTNKSSIEKAAMGRASRRMIRPWGLQQFVSGSLQAVDYAFANKKTCRSMQARFVMGQWKGRYRPV